jgi:hypothetical protein
MARTEWRTPSGWLTGPVEASATLILGRDGSPMLCNPESRSDSRSRRNHEPSDAWSRLG